MSEHFHVVPAELRASAGRVQANSAKARNSVSAMEQANGDAANANHGFASSAKLTACSDSWANRMHTLSTELAGYAGRLRQASGAYEGADTKAADDLRAISEDLGG